MHKVNEPVEKQVARELVFTRIIRAPRPQVFNAWTDPAKLDRWWGPDEFTSHTDSFDLRPGGNWCFTMHTADGTGYRNLVRYREIDPPALLVYMHGSDEENEAGSFMVNVNFDIEKKFTRLTIRAVFSTVAERDLAVREYGAIEGGQQMLNRLEAFLENEIHVYSRQQQSNAMHMITARRFRHL